MCSEGPDERDEWFTSIQLQHWRSGGMVMKEAVLDVFLADSSVRTFMVVLTLDRLVPLEYNPMTGSTRQALPAMQLGTNWFRMNSHMHQLCISLSGPELAYTVDNIRTGKMLFYKLCMKSEGQRTEWMKALQRTSIASSAWIVPEEHVVKEEEMIKFGQVFGCKRDDTSD
jgi:hypothetical protein